jgi:hypothetical protein
MHRMSRPWFIALVLLLSVVTPAAGQDVRPPADSGLEQLTRFARAFAAITAARDEAQAALALAGNKTLDSQRDERNKLKARIASIMREHGFTADDYARMTYVVSTDAARRKQFDELLARLAPKPDPR